MNKIFMYDIETTGVDIETDEILQLAILELTKDPSGPFWLPGRHYERYLGTNRRPANKFAIETMQHIYSASNAVYEGEGNADPVEVRGKLCGFFEECGVPQMAMLAGKNVTDFDIPFSQKAGFLHPLKRDPVTDKMIGEVHYRSYEITGALSIANDVFPQATREEIQLCAAENYPLTFPPELAGRAVHDALYDCYHQTAQLNGLIRMLIRGRLR